MAIDINNFFTNICSKTYNTIGLGTIFSNILHMSFIFTIIMIIIIVFVLPKTGNPYWNITKIFLYIFATCLALFSIHDCIIKNNYKIKYSDKKVTELMSRIGGSTYRQNDIKIEPRKDINLNFDQRPAPNDSIYASNLIEDLNTVEDILNDIESK